jgi:hypothetical protein
VNTEWELHAVIFQAITLIWNRPLIDEKTKWWEDVIEHPFPGDGHCIHRPSFLVWDWRDKCLQFVIQTGGKQIYQGAIPYQSDSLKNYCISGNEGSSTVIETLPRSDSKTVSVDSHRQYNSGGLSSESRGNSLL